MSDVQTIETGTCWVSIMMLILRFYVPGAAWSWLFYSFNESKVKWQQWLITAWLSTVVSILFTTFLTIGLGEFGLLHGISKWLLTGGWILLGLFLGLFRHTHKARQILYASVPGLIGCTLLWSALLCIPQQGEWVVGGWDPGIYINHGVYVSTQGTFHPEPVACYSNFSDDELALFTRQEGDYVETFTGVPIDTQNRNYEIYFFRLLPGLIAALTDCGGLRLAIRVNLLMSIPALLAFAAMCMAFRRRTPFMLMAACLLITQPIWHYLIHLPTSEMLQLILICSAIALAAKSNQIQETILAALCFFGAVINRLTFLPLGMLLLGILSCENLLYNDHKKGYRIGMMGCALLAGTGFNILTAQATIARLTCLVNQIAIVTILLGIVVIILQSARTKPAFRAGLATLYIKSCRGLAIVIPLVLLLLWFRPFFTVFEEAHSNARHLAPYFGPLLLILTFIGTGSILYMTGKKPSTWRGYILFLVIVTALLVYDKHIKNLYPWATRRFFVYSVPLCALAVAHVLCALWNTRKYRKTGRILSILLLLAIVCFNASRSISAWLNTEHNGTINALQEVARHISDDDIIIADHPWWGTPLTFIFNKQVINGRKIWDNKNPEKDAQILKTLQRLYDSGKNIRFLTSTGDKMTIYAPELQNVTLDWESHPFHYRTIIQHRSATGFESSDKSKHFRLYTWNPK